MKQTLQRTLKKSLVGLGRLMPAAWVHGVYVSSNYVLLGKWIEQQGFWIRHRVPDK